jgi:hypothetical protein
VVREFFAKKTDLYQNSMISKDHLMAHLANQDNHLKSSSVENDPRVHECMCNLCGFDINTRAADIA